MASWRAVQVLLGQLSSSAQNITAIVHHLSRVIVSTLLCLNVRNQRNGRPLGEIGRVSSGRVSVPCVATAKKSRARYTAHVRIRRETKSTAIKHANHPKMDMERDDRLDRSLRTLTALAIFIYGAPTSVIQRRHSGRVRPPEVVFRIILTMPKADQQRCSHGFCTASHVRGNSISSSSLISVCKAKSR